MASKKPPSYVKRDRTPALGAPNTGDRALNLFIQNIHERLERLNSETADSIASIRSRLVEVEGDSGGGGGGSGTSNAVVYKGAWDASTGSAPSTSPDQGDYYVVSVDGTTSLSGITDWQVGDWAVYNGTDWSIVRNRRVEAGDNVTVATENGVTTVSAEAGGGCDPTPTYIPAGSTTTVALNSQMLYVLPITVDGTITIDGTLVEVVPA